MALKLRWTRQAIDDKKEILKYWTIRNKSSEYSKKLNEEFKRSLELVKKYPNIGKPSEIEGIRLKIVKDYFIVYKETNGIVFVLNIWDTRRNPEDFKIDS